MSQAPLRVVQPVVIPAQYFLFGTGGSLFGAVFPAFFVFVVSTLIARSSDPVLIYGMMTYIVAFGLLMVLMYYKFFEEPHRTSYAIYPDRIEYTEGLFNRHERTIVFDQVIDVALVEGVLQQSQAAGSITLVTQQLVSGGEGKLSNRSFTLTNVPEPREVYQLIRRLALDKDSEQAQSA